MTTLAERAAHTARERTRRALNPARVAAVKRAWHERNRERVNAQQRASYRRNADAVRARTARWYEANRQRARELNRAWRAAHPQSVAQHRQDWLNAAPDRVAATRAAYSANRRAADVRADGQLSFENVLELWKREPFCIDCGEGRGLDHVIPLSRGGSNTTGNLANRCRYCNSRKGRRLPEEMAA